MAMIEVRDLKKSYGHKTGRPQLSWPDAMVSARLAPHPLRGILASSVVVGLITSVAVCRGT